MSGQGQGYASMEKPPPYSPHGMMDMASAPGMTMPNPPQGQHFGIVAMPVSTTTTVITQPQTPTHLIVTGVTPSNHSMHVNCPHCKFEVSTSVEFETGLFTHLMAGILCLVGCWPCCCIPYCCDSCMDSVHRCPKCQQTIASSKRM